MKLIKAFAIFFGLLGAFFFAAILVSAITTHCIEGREAWEIRTGETITYPFGTHDPDTFITETSIGQCWVQRNANGAHAFWWDGTKFVPVETTTVWEGGGK